MRFQFPKDDCGITDGQLTVAVAGTDVYLVLGSWAAEWLKNPGELRGWGLVRPFSFTSRLIDHTAPPPLTDQPVSTTLPTTSC
jgi:hypothetical protein